VLVKRVRAVAHGAKAIKGRHAQRGREVAVRPAARAALFQRLPQFPRDLSRHLEQAHHAGRPLERRTIEAAGDGQLRAREEGHQGLHVPLDAIRVGPRASPRVDDGAGLGRHHVGPRPARDHADGHGDAACGILQFVDRGDLAGQLADGADALAGVKTGVCGNTAHMHLELANALAAGLEPSARQRRLEHQDGFAAPRLGFDQRLRGGAADLFVGRPQHHDLAVREPASVEHGSRRQGGESNAGLHVEYAWAIQAAGLALERHAIELADRPDRVEMAEHQDLASAAAETHSQVVPRRRCRDARDDTAQCGQPRRQLSTTVVHRHGIVAGRFDRHQGFDEVEQPVALAGAVVEKLAGHGSIIDAWFTGSRVHGFRGSPGSPGSLLPVR